jgi:Ca2+-binding RTX toxin-like protein
MRIARPVCLLVALSALALAPAAAAKPGDVVWGDFSGQVFRVGPGGGTSDLIVDGQGLGGAYGVDFGPDAPYLADSNGTDSGVYRILRNTTTPQLIVQGPPLNNPLDIEFGPDGAAYVAEDSDGVFRVNVRANTINPWSADPADFDVTYALVVAPDRTIYVSDDDDVLRVDPVTHEVTVASTIPDSPLPGTPALTGLERAPSGVLYAYDEGETRVVRINLRTDAVTTVASGDHLGGTYNIAIEPRGTLVMGNYDTGELVRVNPANGSQSLLPGTFTDVEGIAVEPPRCRGKLATIVGSTRADVIRGSRFRDVIAVLGGNDRILGLGAGDIACGGGGSDRLIGGRGADLLLGQGGRDRLIGGKGRDTLIGGPGRDILSGGLGRDRQKQ